MSLTIIVKLFEALIIGLISVLIGFFWHLATSASSGLIAGILTFVIVGTIFFFYDDKPKGVFKSDWVLLVMTLILEALLLFVSFLMTLVLSWVISLAITIPIGFSEQILVVWILLNLYFVWDEIRNGAQARSFYISRYHELP